MIGLLIILAFAIYLAITCGVVWLVIRWARRTGRGVKRWAAAAFLVMYLLVFWDHIPTLALYKYYCNTKAGFWVYKTPEQWKAENPGVAETLTWKSIPTQYKAPGITQGYQLNERFIWANRERGILILPVWINDVTIWDMKTGEVMVKRVSTGAGYKGGKEWLKFWVTMAPCTPGIREFGSYVDSFHQLGREEK